MNKEKIINGYVFKKYTGPDFSDDEMKNRSEMYRGYMDKRRSVRDISNQPVPREVIENLIMTASSAPSGANKQPWTFCIVEDSEMKRKIRAAAEKEEFESYHGRMNAEWLEDLKPLQTDWNKPFLETAPYLIIVFKRAFEKDSNGSKHNNYYVNESVGLACGMLLSAIHHAGLVALTHTPSPMNFLTTILERPSNERPFLLIPVGHPDPDAYVPDITKKDFNEVAKFY